MTNKVELNRLSQVNNNEQNFLAALNENLQRLQAAINDTLSRTGIVPNQMEEVLDMNGNRICNVGAAVEPTDVVTKQDIQNIIDSANEAIAQLDTLVESAKTALQNYANEYIYPVATAALDGAQAAQRAAEAARDALLLNPDYQTIVARLPDIMAVVDALDDLQGILDNMDELLAVSGDLTNIDAVAANLTDLDAIAGNLTEILMASTYAQQAAQSASNASSSASNAATAASSATASATQAASSATSASTAATSASTNAANASSSATQAAGSASSASSSATSATSSANTARIWAEGTDGEVVPLGGSHSAKVWAQYVEQIIAGTRVFGGSFDASTATATLTSTAKVRLGTDANTIVLTNDTTAVTGYESNEAIEYVVTTSGTFAGIPFEAEDILWSSGTAWHKIDASESTTPDASESVKGVAMIATTAEAAAGTNDSKIMTPAKTMALLNTKQDTLTAGAGISIDGNGVISNEGVINTASGSNSVTIGGSVATDSNSVNVGVSAITRKNNATAIGYDSFARDGSVAIGSSSKAAASNSNYQYAVAVGSGAVAYNSAVALGAQAEAAAANAIQIGKGVNTSASTMSVGLSSSLNVQLLDSTGKIPTERLKGMTGADGTNAGTTGAVPAPAATDNTKFLRGDGTWATAGETYTAGTGIDITGGVISVTEPTLTNLSTNAEGLVVGSVGTAQGVLTAYGSVAFGKTINAVGPNQVLIGNRVESKIGNSSALATTVIGANAKSGAHGNISLGANCNNTDAGTFKVSLSTTGATGTFTTYTVLDDTGKVPVDRYIAMTGATASVAGSLGAVPAPAAGDQEKFLRGDGTWQTVSGGGGSVSYSNGIVTFA